MTIERLLAWVVIYALFVAPTEFTALAMYPWREDRRKALLASLAAAVSPAIGFAIGGFGRILWDVVL